MAQIVQNVNLANTFGEWVNTTNGTVDAINALYFSAFNKPTGTLTLSETTTGLVVQGQASFNGLLQVGGTSGSLLVKNSAEVQSVLSLTNKAGGDVNNVVLTANGVSNFNYINVIGTGLAANVSNNMSIGGTLVITGNTSTSANLSVTKDITANNQTINFDSRIGRNLNVTNNLIVSNYSTFTNDASAKQNLYVTLNAYANNIQSNSSVNTSTLTVTGTTYTNNLQANTSANTTTLSVTGTASVNTLQANTLVNTPTVNTNIMVSASTQANVSVNTRTLSVTNTASVDYLQANTAANTRTLSVTGTTSTNVLQANTLVNTPTVNTSILVSASTQANVAVNTTTLSVTNTALVDYLQANTAANTRTLSVTGIASVNTLQANTLVNTPSVNTNIMVSASTQANVSVNTTTISATGTTYTNNLQANTAANTTTLSVTGTTYTNNLQANTAANTTTLSVTGTASVNTLQANTSINTPSVNTSVVNVTGTTYTNNLQANTAANTTTLSVTGTASVNTLQANTLVNTPSVNTSVLVSASTQANVSVNTSTLSVTGTASVNTLQANTLVNTPSVNTSILVANNIQSNSSVNTTTLSVTGTSWTNTLQANTLVNTPSVNTNIIVTNTLQSNSSVNTAYANVGSISVSRNANVNVLTSNTNIIANSGTVWAQTISAPAISFSTSLVGGAGSQITACTATFSTVTVNGPFTISGTTVYSSGTFTLWDGAPLLPNSGGYGAYTINRGEGTNSANANASIRWDNTNLYWALRDVSNPTQYNRILTANDYVSINSSSLSAVTTLNNNITSNVSSAVTTLNNNISANVSTLNTTISNNATSANAVINTANTNLKLYTDTQIGANAVSTNAVITTANTNMKNYVDTANTNLKSYVDNTFIKGSAIGQVQTITSDVTVTGNLIINGVTTTVNTTTVETTDSLLKLAKNNTVGDSIDIGFYGVYQTGGLTRYTGLFRKASDKYYLSQGITTDPTANSVGQYGIGYRATLDGNFTGGTVSGLISPIAVTDGGTGTGTSTGSGSVVLNNSPALVGLPTAPTAGPGNNSTMIATTAYVDTANTAMKGYNDTANTNNILYTNAQITANAVSANAVITAANTNMKNYVDVANNNNILYTNAQITANLSVAQAWANTIWGYANTYTDNANTYLKTYTDSANTSLKSYVDVADNNNILYTNAQISANASTLSTNIINANTAMKTYVDSYKVASISGTSGRTSVGGTVTVPTIDLVTTSVTPGTYGGINYIPSITVDVYGRTTFAGNNAISALALNGQVPIASGGTGASSSGQAITNLLPVASSGDAGKVLTTGGPGSFYWAVAAGGGAQSQGTSINTTRVTYTATAGQTLFTGVGSYTTGAGQLRVYINGVRQFPSDYTETSTSSFTLTSGATLGDIVLAEVDGYNTYTQLASSTSYTASGALTATTVQQGIDQLETNKMPKSGGTFTGQVVLPTGSTTVAPLKFAAGTNLTTAVAGSVEWDGSQLFITNSSATRRAFAYTDSPTITGTPVSPTAASGTSNTMIATTAFVASNFALTASPTFTGTPVSPTAASGTSNTMIATTAFVSNAVSTSTPTGTVISFAGTSAPTGYLALPAAPTNVSRTTYAALFAAIGTTWGTGDGSTTFGIPYVPIGYSLIQGTPGSTSVGAVIAHTHGGVVGFSNYYGAQAGNIVGNGLDGFVYSNGAIYSTGSTGGNANLPAGTNIIHCIKY